jgi:hypothetical protein
VGHVGSMGESSFPTLSEVAAFLSDDPIVAMSGRLLLVDSKFWESDPSKLKVTSTSITTLVILDCHDVRSWDLRVTISFAGRSVDYS